MAGRFLLEPSYLDIRSNRDDDVHRGLAWQVGFGARSGDIRPYLAVGAKPEGQNLAWLSTGVRFRIRQRVVITPEVRLGYFDIEPSPRGYMQLSVNLGTSFAWERTAANPPSKALEADKRAPAIVRPPAAWYPADSSPGIGLGRPWPLNGQENSLE
jgi:hypothetical protein